MVKRWPFAAVLVLISGCSAILGFSDGEAIDGGIAGGDGGDDRSTNADTSLDALRDRHADAPTDVVADAVSEAGADAAAEAGADAAAEAGADAAAEAGPKAAFETVAVFNGRLDALGIAGAGGLAAGDARCMEAAQASFPGRTFIAWLSTAGISAASRVAGGGPWYVDGSYLGTTMDLMTGKLHTPLNKGPAGEATPAPLGVWTGSTEVGASAPGVCLDWTTTAPGATGEIGTSGAVDGTWLYAADRGCNFFFHLYCFEK